MKRILVVEDHELNLDLLVQLLEDRYQVVTATDGASGLDMAQELRPDAILMDLSLPVVDGWEAIRRLKDSPELSPIPVIALTAHAMAGDEERARDCGCDDYMTKPIDEDVLFAKLQHYLGVENDV
jgi:CheY-like chemotaxis protein